ncbi:MAG: GNAT family N-acetyltransferase [Winkia neuii]|uniref:GNAT family N-acetyltransferase n=1 Tax=Winkia neuii TaxID=33007 RepID=A0A2I1IL28_9ACTO|nr:GNAT family N-acetyltransferase [Winkia neuii]OFJ70136.1 hypothetical protein HMPREF2851_10350 [Actinomyces sp. HMSC064C12]OFK04458.1 hypothetical protein HMPREF2835_04340 [Actinomyces sp. HMSC072A03]OFT56292.1 hypothetical protein HMPREF3152_01915 [Actinomyces sp. HMSC06A08]KWZ72145.1 acetyltransferase, GNAT family [Winkia neuii]MDK8099890.1 GNAT family N-acetyltransferase [Winkia neuii]
MNVQWRKLSRADSALVAELTERIQRVDNPPYRTSRAEIEADFSADQRWRSFGAFVQGKLIAYGHALFRPSDPARVICIGGVDPHFRRQKLGGHIVDLQVQAAQELLGASQGEVIMHVDEGMAELVEVLRSRGFSWTKTYYELRAPLHSLGAVPADPFITIVPWSVDLDDELRLAINAITEQTWGSTPLSAQEWAQGRPHFSAQNSFIALDKSTDRTQIAGLAMCSLYRQDWQALGVRECYIDIFAVGEPWRETHVGRRLLAAVMEKGAADGLEAIGAGISSLNDSGALDLYHSLGFRTVARTRSYSMQLPN